MVLQNIKKNQTSREFSTSTFFDLDFVLRIAPQQGHRKLSTVKNTLHIEHLF